MQMQSELIYYFVSHAKSQIQGWTITHLSLSNFFFFGLLSAASPDDSFFLFFLSNSFLSTSPSILFFCKTTQGTNSSYKLHHLQTAVLVFPLQPIMIQDFGNLHNAHSQVDATWKTKYNRQRLPLIFVINSSTFRQVCKASIIAIFPIGVNLCEHHHSTKITLIIIITCSKKHKLFWLQNVTEHTVTRNTH